jgi:hypothetical protein
MLLLQDGNMVSNVAGVRAGAGQMEFAASLGICMALESKALSLTQLLAKSTILLALGLVGISVTAGASTIYLTDTVTSPSSNVYTVTTASGQNPASYPALDPTLAYTLSGDQFNGSGQIATPTLFGAAATGTNGPWNFQDSYNFVISSSATAQSAVISIGSTLPAGLTNLQVRIINGSLVNSANPQLGTPTNGTVSGDTWASYNFANGSYAFTMPAGLTGGNDYILQVRGDATLGQSSSYGGTLTFTAVPLPAGLPLLLSGIAGLGWIARPRKRALA